MEIKNIPTEITTNKIKKFTYRQWALKIAWGHHHHKLAKNDNWEMTNKIDSHLNDMYNKFNWKPFYSQNLHMRAHSNYNYLVKINGNKINSNF